MKFHAILLASLMMPICTFAADALFPFQLGSDTFHPEVTQWWDGIMGNLAKEAQKDNSEWAKWTLERTKQSLEEVCANKQVLDAARAIYTQIQQDEVVKQAFNDARNATVEKDTLTERTQKWTTFRRVAAQQLHALSKAELPLVQVPTPGSARALEEFIERNREVQLDKNEQNKYEAYNLVLYTFRENQLLVDAESDNANALLHKNVTDKRKDS